MDKCGTRNHHGSCDFILPLLAFSGPPLILNTIYRELSRKMVNRRQTRNQIRGPHSALTDFLASNNISAAQIREDYRRRLEEAEHQGASEEPSEPAENDEAEQSLDESSEQRKNRKRKEAANLAKIKQSKEPQWGAPLTGRRQNQSNLLDGIAQQGALSLAEMCTKKVADNINDIEEFGDLPSPLLHRLSQILSKRRALTSRTLNLFLRPDLDSINIYDSAKLETNDFQKIFAFMPTLTNVNLRFAGQLKNTVIEYLLGRDLRLKYLQLDAANLVSDSHWRRLFEKLGPQLEALKLSNLDFSLDDETVEVLCRNCTELRRLKLKQCWKISFKRHQTTALLK
ncbi:hypothetical protein AFLA_005453 [Aspergillus flavus NRRL3357]|nr:hypothetical protein AFLA_005453 [Aspergillus flavus NRRL3357]